MIEKGQFVITGKTVQPQRELGQMDGQGIQVNTVETMARNQTSPHIRITGYRRDHSLNVGNFSQETDDEVRDLIRRINKKVSAPHGRVAEFEGQNNILDESLHQ